MICTYTYKCIICILYVCTYPCKSINQSCTGRLCLEGHSERLCDCKAVTRWKKQGWPTVTATKKKVNHGVPNMAIQGKCYMFMRWFIYVQQQCTFLLRQFPSLFCEHFENFSWSIHSWCRSGDEFITPSIAKHHLNVLRTYSQTDAASAVNKTSWIIFTTIGIPEIE